MKGSPKPRRHTVPRAALGNGNSATFRGRLPRTAHELFNLVFKIPAILQVKGVLCGPLTEIQFAGVAEFHSRSFKVRCRQLRWQKDLLPLLPSTLHHPFPREGPPGRWLLQHSQLHAVFYSITCCALPTGTLKAVALIVKLPCDLIHLISFEHWDNGCCLSSICCHLFFCTCHLPDNKGGSFSQGVRPVSVAELQQPVIPQGLSFPTKAWSHTGPT